MPDQSTRVTTVLSPQADAGLRCPRCDYNLTGLPEARCPECGEVFDWELVRRAGVNPPRVHFERVRGWRKVPGFFVTWATVLFAPWIFARQVVARVSAVHALVFVLICLGGTFAAMFSGAEMSFMLTWVTTALIYVSLQALVLGVLDFSGWRHPLRSLRFWLLIGCYTSAIMPTEVVLGPPMLALSDLRDLVAGQSPSTWVDALYKPTWQAAVLWSQMGLWVGGLACCYAVRIRRGHHALTLVIVAGLLVALVVVVLYAAAYEHIGMWVYDWFGHSF